MAADDPAGPAEGATHGTVPPEPAPPAAPPRRSRLAVWACLAYPASLALAVAAYAIPVATMRPPRSEWAGAILALAVHGIVAGAGWIASIVAWTRIRTSRGGLSGTAWAVTGILVPLLGTAALAAGFLLILVEARRVAAAERGRDGGGASTASLEEANGPRPGGRFPRPGRARWRGPGGSPATDGSPPADETSAEAVGRLLRELDRAGPPARPPEDAWLVRLYGPALAADLRRRLRDDAEGFLGDAAAGALGLPLAVGAVVKPPLLPAPLLWTTEGPDAGPDGDTAVATLGRPDGTRVLYPLVRADGVWRFAAGPVVVEGP